MKKFSALIALILTLAFQNINSQPIIINELYNSGGNDEWIELLVLEEGLDIRNWSIRDFSSSGVAQQPLNFTNNELWNNLKKGTLIVIARAENAFTEDLDASDYNLTVKTNNSLYLSGTSFLFAGSSEAVQIRNSSQVHVYGVSWGSANSSSLPDPKIHFNNSAVSNTSTFFNEDAVAKLSIEGNWTRNGSSSRGQGNTTNNSNWITSLRARVEGSGVVNLTPNIADGGSKINLEFSYRKENGSPINAFQIILPAEFSWPQNTAQVLINNFTSPIEIKSDTVLFTSVEFFQDSITIMILDVTVPTITGNYAIHFQSGVDSVFGDVSPLPVLTVYGAPIPIAEAKINDENGLAVDLGRLVTIRGIVTVAEQFGSPSYVQDNTAGISIFGSSFSNSVQVGDEVLVSGTITQFNGLNQLEFPILHEIISSGNQVDPLLSTPINISSDGSAGIENYEGQLIRLNNVLVTELNGSPVASWAYKNYLLTGNSSSDTVQLRIDNNSNLIGIPAPAGRFDVVGVVSQFKTSSPFIGGYQVMPRFSSDIISSGPIIEKFPQEVELTPNSITLEWTTISAGTSRIRYGKTHNYELGVASPDDLLRTNHIVTVEGLTPATIYNLQVFSVLNSDTSFSGNIISSTTSPYSSTGSMNIYFNKSVNTNISLGTLANGNADFKSILLQRINTAARSIDAALYSLSGAVGAEIANALVAARNRGVKVRVIGEYDNQTTAPWSTIQNNGIPYLNDRAGSNDGMGFSHNKFFIFDYRGGSHDSIWLITGSWNPTDAGTNDDRQNIIEIQDAALAGAYTREFEEMWGSENDIPNPTNSRFGSRKLNNTPHNFIIGGRKVECYFSPSDRTTFNIGKIIGKAEKSVNAAAYTFTRRDLADSVISAKLKGAKTRIILSNNTDTGTQFFYLQSNGVDIRLKGFPVGFLHHKYAIIDAEPSGNAAYVITGSHNWSSSAENVNDENTLIIQDADIANQYLQEFAARYYEAGGSDSIFVTDINNDFSITSDYYLSQNYPNPFNPITNINYSIPVRNKVELNVYNALGQSIAVLVDETKEAGSYKVSFDASALPSGVYFYRISAGEFSKTNKLVLIK